jgi:hypothetical protein
MSTSIVVSSLEFIPLPPAAPQVRRPARSLVTVDRSQALVERESAELEFVTFDSTRKYLARIVAVNGKKVTVRLFSKKTKEWLTKNENRGRDHCIPLSTAEAEEHFPGSVAAWDETEARDIFARSTTAVQAATFESPNIQPLDISAPQTLLSAEEKHELIEDLVIAHQTIRRSVIEAGNILRQLRNGTVHGEWERLLAEICKKLKISRATAHNYMDAAVTVDFLSPLVAGACRDNNLNLEKKPIRDAVARTVADNPNATPAEIVAQVKAAIHRSAVRNPAVAQLAELRNHYRKHQNVLIERVGRGTNGLEMPHFQVWVKDVPAQRAPSGDQQITVIMTFDQLRSVEGKVSIGANELTTPDEVKQFLKTWGVK